MKSFKVSFFLLTGGAETVIAQDCEKAWYLTSQTKFTDTKLYFLQSLSKFGQISRKVCILIWLNSYTENQIYRRYSFFSNTDQVSPFTSKWNVYYQLLISQQIGTGEAEQYSYKLHLLFFLNIFDQFFLKGVGLGKFQMKFFWQFSMTDFISPSSLLQLFQKTFSFNSGFHVAFVQFSALKKFFPYFLCSEKMVTRQPSQVVLVFTLDKSSTQNLINIFIFNERLLPRSQVVYKSWRGYQG